MSGFMSGFYLFVIGFGFGFAGGMLLYWYLVKRGVV
jgi:hypothetical protein